MKRSVFASSPALDVASMALSAADLVQRVKDEGQLYDNSIGVNPDFIIREIRAMTPADAKASLRKHDEALAENVVLAAANKWGIGRPTSQEIRAIVNQVTEGALLEEQASTQAGRGVQENEAENRTNSSSDAGQEGVIAEVCEVFVAPQADGKYRATVLSGKPLTKGDKLFQEPLYITLIPLVRYVINLLQMKPPLTFNIRYAIAELQKILDGKSLSAGAPSEEWLRVAEIAHSTQPEKRDGAMSTGFIPHPECTVSSGACFQESACLGDCTGTQDVKR